MKIIFTIMILLFTAIIGINDANATTCEQAAVIPATPTFPYISSLACGTTNDINSLNATPCGNGSYMGGLEAVYLWTPGANYTNVSFAYTGQVYTGIFLYQGCPTSGGTCLANRTSSASSKTLAYLGSNQNSGTSISLVSGITYYLVIDTWPQPASPCPGTLTVNGTIDPACSGTPAPGNTLSSDNPVCPGISFTLSLQNSTPGIGVAYQWQKSSTGSDPWENVGTSASTYVTTQSETNSYRCQVTCAGNTGVSNPIQVTMDTWINCYCLPTYANGGPTDYITQVALETLSQATSGNVSPYYIDYTSTQNAVPDLVQDLDYSLSLSFSADGNQYNGVWVDFNQSGTFETNEFYTSGTNAGSGGTVTVLIQVPISASLGITRMRIRGGDDEQPLNTQACGASNSTWGQAQDYMVNVIATTLPYLLVVPGLLDFPETISGGTSTELIYNLSADNLIPESGDITVTPPENFEVSLTSGGGFSSSAITVAYTDGVMVATPIYVIFKPTTPGIAYSGNISNAGGGADAVEVAVSGISSCSTISEFSYTLEFNDGVVPPICWSEIITNPDYNWQASITNPGWADVEYDPDLVPQDEWLVTPLLDFTNLEHPRLAFNWMMSYYWSVDPYDYYDLNCKVSTDGGSTWTTTLWSEEDEGVFSNFTKYTETIDLQAYGGQSNVKIAWQYAGADGAQAAIDSVVIDSWPSCPAPENLEVLSLEQNSAEVNWDVPAGYAVESFFDVTYDLTGFDPETEGTLVSGITTPPVTIQGLTPNTTYDVYSRTICQGFVTPKIDYFWLALNDIHVLELPSGGIFDEDGETGIWEYYTPPSGDQWYNIWFYNDDYDPTRMKIIRMGFYVQTLDPLIPTGTINYVVNWSTPGWVTPPPPAAGYPSPDDESFIERSPLNGPYTVYPADPDNSPNGQWMELYFIIPEYNPEWVSVDIWGQNITILYQAIAPPAESALLAWWTPAQPGGIIVHECLPKPMSNVSPWSLPITFKTLCQDVPVGICESFDSEVFPPECWGTQKTAGESTQGAWDRQTAGFYPACLPHSGSGMTRYNSNNYLAGTSGILCSLPFTLPALSQDYMVRFWMYRDSQYPTNADLVNVHFNTSPSLSAATLLGTINRCTSLGPVVSEEGWYDYYFALPTGQEGDGRYIIFEAISQNGNNIFIDDVCIISSLPCTLNTWTGNASNEWNAPANWSCLQLPDASMNVLIPSGLDNYPVIGPGMTFECYDISTEAGAIITIQGTLILVNQ